MDMMPVEKIWRNKIVKKQELPFCLCYSSCYGMEFLLLRRTELPPFISSFATPTADDLSKEEAESIADAYFSEHSD